MYEIRRATIKDSFDIANILFQGWKFAYSDILDQEIMSKYTLEKRIKQIEQNINSETSFVYLLDKKVVAFTRIDSAQDDDKDDNTFEIIGFYVLPKFTRQGIGTNLLRYIEKLAFQQNKKEITVWALKDNFIGGNFYIKSGFSLDGTEKYFENIKAISVRYDKKLED
jgi:ribosomal protein S18 acetylase RimI-like enzyme